MRKLIGILLYIAAGFFVYMVCVLAFVNQAPVTAKWCMVAGFSIPATLFLFSGLAVNRFKNWRMHSGTVLLSGAGFTLFVVFTFACVLMTEEFRRMMKPEAIAFFSAYTSGSIFLAFTGALGALLLKSGKKRAEGQGVQGTQTPPIPTPEVMP